MKGTNLCAMDGEGLLLPWESQAAFDELRQRFHLEHGPDGPTEQALVDRLVWIEWRRRRLRLAERAAHMAGLADRLDHAERLLKRAGVSSLTVRAALEVDIADVVMSGAAQQAEQDAARVADQEATQRALAILDSGGGDAYARAMAALDESTREWWTEESPTGEDGQECPWTADVAGLAAFLREEVEAADADAALADAARPAVRAQAHGESFDPIRMERLLALDAQLDRQFEKALAVLIQLRERREPGPRRATAPRPMAR